MGKVVFYESPHRILEHLKDARDCFGPSTRLFVAREITKTHEEYAVSSIENWIETFTNRTPKGEFVLIYERIENITDFKLDEWIENELKAGRPSREILKEGQSKTRINRKELYNKIMEIKEKL